MKRRTAVAMLAALALLTWGTDSVRTEEGARQTQEQERGRDSRTIDFRYERLAQPGAAGPNRLSVDVPLLAGGKPFTVVPRMLGVGYTGAVAQGGLADLRFFDEQGREVPYLLVQPPPRVPDWVAARVLPVAATKKTSGFEVDLGQARNVDRLAVVGLPAPYLKRARLEGSGDRARWTMLADATTLFDLPNENLAREEIEFPGGEYRYLRVTWDDTNSARMPQPRGARARLLPSGAAPAPLRASIAFERRAAEPGVSRYRLRLPAANLPVVAIELEIDGGYVLREARVMESRLDGTAMGPVQLGGATLRRAVQNGVAAAELKIPIITPRESQLELIVEDGSNRPLDLAGVTALFAELPWIYLEAPSERALLARFGSPRLDAPRYDLEAVRPSIDRLQPARASWGEPLNMQPKAAVAEEASLPTVGAAVDTSRFAHRRPIPPGPRGLTALQLDAAVLAASHLSDLRVVKPDGRQMAYLVERLDEPLTLVLPEPRPVQAASLPTGAASIVEEGARATVYRIDFPEEGLPESRLVLETSARVFSRSLQILRERRSNRDRDGRTLEVLATSAWKHGEPETPAPPLTLALPDGLPRSAWLVVEEGDNAPLPLGRPRLLLPAYRLRFFRETDDALALIYGNAEAAAPRYDLALLAPRLVGAAAHEVSPGKETGARGEATAIPGRWFFWSALVAAVVVLLGILARLLRS